jgi:hypothetical protein
MFVGCVELQLWLKQVAAVLQLKKMINPSLKCDCFVRACCLDV